MPSSQENATFVLESGANVANIKSLLPIFFIEVIINSCLSLLSNSFYMKCTKILEKKRSQEEHSCNLGVIKGL